MPFRLVEAIMFRHSRIVFSVLVALYHVSVKAGTWTNQYYDNRSDTAIITIAAASEEYVYAFGVEPDGQGNSKPVWFRTIDGGKKWAKQDAVQGSDPLMMTHMVCTSENLCWAVGVKLMLSGGFGVQNLLMRLDAKSDNKFMAPLPYTVSRIAPRAEKDMFLIKGPVVVPVVDGKPQSGFVPQVDGERYTGITDASFVGANLIFLVNGEVQTDEKTQKKTILPRGALLKSDNGGKTWTAVFQNRPETVDRVWFFSANTGFVLGHSDAGPFLRRTDDGGQTWFELTFPQPGGVPRPKYVMDSVMFNAKAGIFVASDKDEHDQSYHVVFRMRDGYTLVEEPLPATTRAMFAITCPSQKVCYMAGENHVIWRFDGTDADVVTDEPSQADHAFSDLDSAVAVPEEAAGGTDVRAGPHDVAPGMPEGAQGGGSRGGGCSTAEGNLWGFILIGAALVLHIALSRRFAKPTSKT